MFSRDLLQSRAHIDDLDYDWGSTATTRSIWDCPCQNQPENKMQISCVSIIYLFSCNEGTKTIIFL